MPISNIFKECNEYRIVDTDNVVLPNPDNFRVIEGPIEFASNLILGFDRLFAPGTDNSESIGLWGFESEKTAPDGETGFRCGDSGGKDLLQQIYDANGPDATAKLQLGIVENGIFDLQREWEIGFRAYRRNDTLVFFPLKDIKFEDKILARRKLKVDLLATESIDGVALTPLTQVTVPLPQKVILKQSEEEFENDVNILQNNSSAKPQGQNNTDIITNFVQFGFSKIVKEEATDIIAIPFAYNPVIPSANFIADETGTHNFRVNLDWSSSITNAQNQGLTILNETTTFDLIFSINGVPEPALSNNFIDSINYVNTLNLTAGDEIRVYAIMYDEVEWETDPGQGGTLFMDFQFMMNAESNWEIDLESVTPATNGTGFYIHDTCRRTLEIIADQEGIFQSEFLELLELGFPGDGCGGKILTLNGFGIRGFTLEDRPIQPSHENNFKTLRALFNFGAGYEKDALDNDIIRMEPISHFFQNRLIFRIPYVIDSTFNVRSATEILFNKILVGYDDNSTKDSDVNTLDDIHVETEFMLPFKKITNVNDYRSLSAYLASAYLMEIKRREQFAEEPTTGNKNDDDIFLLALHRRAFADWVAETIQPFDIFDNVLDPDNYANARYKPARMLRNHATFLNSGLFHKAGTDEVQFRFSEGNYDVRTQFNAAEQCNVGDPNKDLIVGNADIELDDFNDFLKLFEPQWIDFETRITWDQYIEGVIKPHQNNSVNGDNYGYYEIEDPNDGAVLTGYLFNSRYEPNTQKWTATLLTRAIN